MGLSSIILIVFLIGMTLLFWGTTKQQPSYKRAGYLLVAAAAIGFFIFMGFMRG